MWQLVDGAHLWRRFVGQYADGGVEELGGGCLVSGGSGEGEGSNGLVKEAHASGFFVGGLWW